MTSVVDIEGVGAASAQKLDTAGIKTLRGSLKKALPPKAAQKLPKNQASVKN